MGVTEFLFYKWVTESKIKGVFAGLFRCQGYLLRHKNDRVLFGNNRCFIWYHNIAVMWYSVEVPIILKRVSRQSVETGLSHLNTPQKKALIWFQRFLPWLLKHFIWMTMRSFWLFVIGFWWDPLVCLWLVSCQHIVTLLNYSLDCCARQSSTPSQHYSDSILIRQTRALTCLKGNKNYIFPS